MFFILGLLILGLSIYGFMKPEKMVRRGFPNKFKQLYGYFISSLIFIMGVIFIIMGIYSYR